MSGSGRHYRRMSGWLQSPSIFADFLADFLADVAENSIYPAHVISMPAPDDPPHR
jgi:hypothetical protein